MRVQFTTALAVLFMASVPQHLRAAPDASSGPFTAKAVRRAGATAKTGTDHLRRPFSRRETSNLRLETAS